MVAGDLIRELFRSYAAGDRQAFRVAAERVIQEERLKNHRLLADDLQKILMNSNGRSTERRLGFEDVPRDKERGFPLLSLECPDYDWDRIIIPPDTEQTLRNIVEQNHRRQVLATAGLKPTQRVLFYGPPGCGKSLGARVLSGELGYPLALVRFDAVVSSYLGETAANLRRVFEFIQSDQWVVLFDEFDAIGKDRDNQFEHGELKRVVNTLLQLMDAYEGDSLLIAATNHESLLDEALWRRFDELVYFGPPTNQEQILLFRLFLRGFDTKALNYKTLARRLSNATGSDIERICIEAARQAVLSGRTSIHLKDFEDSLRGFAKRSKVDMSQQE